MTIARVMSLLAFLATLQNVLTQHSPPWLRSNLVTWALLLSSATGCARLLDLDALTFHGEQLCTSAACEAGTQANVEAGADESAEAGAEVSSEAGAPVECTSHRECTPYGWSEPAVCLNRACVALKNDTGCGLVLGDENLQKDTTPFVFGLLSGLPLESYAPTRSLDLAVSEFSRMGLKVQGQSVLPVAVVCDSIGTTAQFDAAVDHLVDTLGVTALVAGLDALALKRTFERVHARPGKDVFFLSPFSSDSLLTTLDDSGLLWHMLPDPLELGPTYPPLIKRVETHVRRSLPSDVERPLRLALVESSAPDDADLGAYLDRNLTFNGVSLRDNAADNVYLRLRIEDSEIDGSATLGKAFEALRNFAPDVIIALAGYEFISGLMRPLEISDSLHPFYVFSHSGMGRELMVLMQRVDDLHERVLGVNPAGAEDGAMYEEFLSNVESRHPQFQGDGTENFYDAVYHLLYAVSAAGQPAQLSGSDVALGMLRLMSGPRFDVGATSIPAAVSRLQLEDTTLALHGVMGPPAFDVETGARLGQGSVWCVSMVNGEPETQFDALRYDAATDTLQGTFVCNEDL